MNFLAVNAGSSSLKFALYPAAAGWVDTAIFSGQIEGLAPGGQPQLSWRVQGQAAQQRQLTGSGDPFALALDALQACLRTTLAGAPPVAAVAHRVVHGGRFFQEAVEVTPAVLAQLRTLESLAPLHQPHNLDALEAFIRAMPGVPQVACFDTAFHASLPATETTFAIDRALSQEGIRRYGFHGLSYQYVSGVLQAHTPRAGQRVIMAHLGNGASLCATREHRSVATTMGFSALDGLMMGSRSGALDPGVLLYLLEQGWDHDRIQTLLYKRSGLLGVSGVSADMRTLRASTDPQAAFAIALFAHRVLREIGALSAVLGGLDVLAFTGGIGEHDALLRQTVCDGLAYLGVAIDAPRQARATGNAVESIHAQSSAVEVWVVPTDEGRVAAQEAQRLLARKSPS